MAIQDSTIQEQLSLAYINAVASYAGYSFQETKASADFGIDGMVMSTTLFNGKYRPNGAVLNVQLKATHTHKIIDDNVHYQLSMDAYEKLKSPTILPQLLVVFTMPKDKKLWLGVYLEKLILCKSAHWILATSLPENVKNKDNVTIKIPQNNIFDPESLKLICKPMHDKLADMGTL